MAQKVFDYEAAVAQIVKWGWGDAVASVPAGYKFWSVCVYDRRFKGGHGYDWLAIPVGTQPYEWNQVVTLCGRFHGDHPGGFGPLSNAAISA